MPLERIEKIPFRKKIRAKKIILPVSVIVIVWALLSLVSNHMAWKVVFLDSNQVYFGKFTYKPFSSTITVRDAHYLKSDALKPEDGSVPSLVILPITGDAHQPTSEMVIRKDHILYYQKLKPGTTLYSGLEKETKR